MSKDINEYFHEYCDKMFCEECEMENDKKEEYVCYHQGFYVKGYQQGIADERERIVNELEELHERYLNRYGIIGNHSLSAIMDAIEIVRGVEND